MEEVQLTEEFITKKVKEYLHNKVKGNWHESKTKEAPLHGHGVDLEFVGGNGNGEHFFIECKGKSYAKSAKSINRECWLNALGQVIQRMKVKSNGAYKYGLGLYWVTAQTALRRIPRNVALTLNLHIFACNDKGEIKQFTPKDFEKEYEEKDFY